MNKQFQANLGGCRSRDLLMPLRDSACCQSPSNMHSAITRNGYAIAFKVASFTGSAPAST
jgi:hypothetical protein